MKDNELLHSFKIQLEQYKTFSCKLRHETIINFDSNKGTDNLGLPLESMFNRVGFCNHSFRSVTINCAHTTAAIKFKDLIKNISQQLEDFQGAYFIKAIDDLLCEIYLLDHKRGSLEKIYAFTKHKAKDSIQDKQTKHDIDSLIKHHSKLVTELDVVRQTIVNELNQFID